MYMCDGNKETKDPGQIIFICHGPFVTKYERSSMRVIEYQVFEMVKQKIQDKEGIHIKECWAG